MRKVNLEIFEVLEREGKQTCSIFFIIIVIMVASIKLNIAQIFFFSLMRQSEKINVKIQMILI